MFYLIINYNTQARKNQIILTNIHVIQLKLIKLQVSNKGNSELLFIIQLHEK